MPCLQCFTEFTFSKPARSVWGIVLIYSYYLFHFFVSLISFLCLLNLKSQISAIIAASSVQVRKLGTRKDIFLSRGDPLFPVTTRLKKTHDSLLANDSEDC